MTNWDKRWFDLCELISTWSKDRSRKVGAVIVDSKNNLISFGWNGFPRNVDDDIESRHERPTKYLFTEHAERNAIYNCARNGISPIGSTMYLKWYPCADCARAIIQSGIVSVFCVEPDWNDSTYRNDFIATKEMMCDANIIITFIEGIEAPAQKRKI
jgi:dCMP deaminase